jgi:hypothetical protein
MPAFAEPLNTVNSTLISVVVVEVFEEMTENLNDYMSISGTSFIATLDDEPLSTGYGVKERAAHC